MRVLELWRYPVKSLQGERLEASEVGSEGLAGDRQYTLFDAATGFGLTARRVPELLFASARWHADGHVEITLPDGTVAPDDVALSAWLGREVVLRPATADVSRRYENPNMITEDEERDWEPFHGARGAFHDSPRSRVSLVSRGSLGHWDARRFRANVVLDGQGEDRLVGSRVEVGTCLLDVRKQISRCVMVTRPQPGGLERDLDVLRTVNAARGGHLCIGALVERPGTIRVGDELHAI